MPDPKRTGMSECQRSKSCRVFFFFLPARANIDVPPPPIRERGFAFWHGLYDEEIDGVELGSNSAAAVQSSRDSNYKTDHKGETCQRIKNGQDKDKAAKKKELDGIAASIAATFSQATLKYAAEMLQGEDQALIDKKWGEGYTYFR